MASLQEIIKSLENGICPAELLFNGTTAAEELDWDKILYNTKYNTAHFYESKFPDVVTQLPAFDKIIDVIVEKNKDNSPLKEIEERQNIYLEIEDNDDIDSTIHKK